MASIREVKKKLRQREWSEEIAECQNSGMKIKEWCQMKGISPNTYYRRLRMVRTALLEQDAHTFPDGDTACPSAQIVALIDKAAEYERTARENQYTAQQILIMRAKIVKPLLDQVYEIINTLRPRKDSALDTAVTYALNQKEKLFLFLTHPEVEMTNNLAERTVKPYVINRKNFLFSDTEKGADASAAVMSIIETAKRNNLDVYGYLLYLLTVLPEMRTNPTDDQIKSIMPWNFTLPAYCRQTYKRYSRRYTFAYSSVQFALYSNTLEPGMYPRLVFLLSGAGVVGAYMT